MRPLLKKMIKHYIKQNEYDPFLLDRNVTHPLSLRKTKKINFYSNFSLIFSIYEQKLTIFALKTLFYPQKNQNCGQNRSEYFNLFNTFHGKFNQKKCGFMFDPQSMFDIDRAVLRSVAGLNLSFLAMRLYSYLYVTHKIFGKSFNLTHEELSSAIKCKIKGYKILKELSQLNLIKQYCGTNIEGWNILLFPPTPFVFLKATIKTSDFSYNLIPIKNVYLAQDNFKKITLKHGLVYLSSDHPYQELLQTLNAGDSVYFVTTKLIKQPDETWELKEVFNLLTDTREINHG